MFLQIAGTKKNCPWSQAKQMFNLNKRYPQGAAPVNGIAKLIYPLVN